MLGACSRKVACLSQLKLTPLPLIPYTPNGKADRTCQYHKQNVHRSVIIELEFASLSVCLCKQETNVLTLLLPD